jgi:hypothetical protein
VPNLRSRTRLEPATTGEPGKSFPGVRGLVLPVLLASLLASGRWQHPGDDVLHRGGLPTLSQPNSSAEGVMSHAERTVLAYAFGVLRFVAGHLNDFLPVLHADRITE